MLRETGQVTKIDGDWMEVALSPTELCESCRTKDECIFKDLKCEERSLQLPRDARVTAGDRVTLEVPSSVYSFVVAVVFIVPAFLVIAGYLLVDEVLAPSHSELWGSLWEYPPRRSYCWVCTAICGNRVGCDRRSTRWRNRR